MSDNLLVKAEKLFSQLPVDAPQRIDLGHAATLVKLRYEVARQMKARGLAKAAAIPPEQLQGLVDAVKAAEQVAKGAVQDALNGMGTPELGGQIASGGSGVTAPATSGVIPGLSQQSPSGLPGLGGPILGGQSTYQIPAEAGLAGGGEVQQGQGQGLAAMVRALGSQRQELPGPPANPQLVKAVQEAAAAEKTLKETRERSAYPHEIERAAEDATVSRLRLHAIAQFGAGPRGGA